MNTNKKKYVRLCGINATGNIGGNWDSCAFIYYARQKNERRVFSTRCVSPSIKSTFLEADITLFDRAASIEEI